MQFESLHVFCDVARNRSFSQAAHLNGVTQSAVSQMVANLERNMGVQLIDRSTRPLQLTPLGKTYFEGCKQLLEEYCDLVASLRTAQARVDGTVQIAAIYSVGLGNMSQYVEQFTAIAPRAEVNIDYLHPDRVYQKVLDGSVDFGLVSFPKKTSKLIIVPWREERMIVACPPGHPLAGLPAIPVERLNDVKYVHFSRELGIRREIDRFYRSRKVSVKAALEFDNIENIKKAVEISAGVALLPEPTFQKEMAAETLVGLPLADEEFCRPLGIIYRRQHKLSAAAQNFLALLRGQKLAAAEPAQPAFAADSHNNHPRAHDGRVNGRADGVHKKQTKKSKV